MERKWVLYSVVVPIRDQKPPSKCTNNYYFGDIKMIFFWGGSTGPSPDLSPAPNHLGASPPFRNSKYATGENG